MAAHRPGGKGPKPILGWTPAGDGAAAGSGAGSSGLMEEDVLPSDFNGWIGPQKPGRNRHYLGRDEMGIKLRFLPPTGRALVAVVTQVASEHAGDPLPVRAAGARTDLGRLARRSDRDGRAGTPDRRPGAAGAGDAGRGGDRTRGPRAVRPLATWPIAGRTGEEWCPVVVCWAARRCGRRWAGRGRWSAWPVSSWSGSGGGTWVPCTTAGAARSRPPSRCGARASPCSGPRSRTVGSEPGPGCWPHWRGRGRRCSACSGWPRLSPTRGGVPTTFWQHVPRPTPCRPRWLLTRTCWPRWTLTPARTKWCWPCR